MESEHGSSKRRPPSPAPALLDGEVAQVLRRLVADGIMTEGRGRVSIEILGETYDAALRDAPGARADVHVLGV